jgi:uncharacterized protein (DUF305 family)
MSRWSKGFLAIVALLAVSLALVACSDDPEAATGTTTTAQGNATERAFLSAMVPHHESAVAMAELAQSRSQSAFVRDLADAIVADQRAEIAEMGDIHRRLFGTELVPDEMAHEELGLSAEAAGMGHSEQAMEMLATADPFDRAFVDEMVAHHLGAIAMAEAALEGADDAEVRELAESIIEAQRDEVERMSAFREEQYGAPAATTAQPEDVQAEMGEEAPSSSTESSSTDEAPANPHGGH